MKQLPPDMKHSIFANTNVKLYILLVKFIKLNQNYYLKLDVSTSVRGVFIYFTGYAR